MSETYEKMRKVTFSDGLPRGTIATFVHDGVTWEAYPRQKFRDIHDVQVRLFGIVDRIHADLVDLINTRPEDASRVLHIMARTANAKRLVMQKVRAWTMIGTTEDSEGENGTKQDTATVEGQTQGPPAVGE